MTGLSPKQLFFFIYTFLPTKIIQYCDIKSIRTFHTVNDSKMYTCSANLSSELQTSVSKYWHQDLCISQFPTGDGLNT